MSKKFIIIDAMALAYKAYFAFMSRPLITSKGEPTSAVYGFINQLLKILEDNKPDYIAVAFDAREKTFRHEQYSEYKAARHAMPDDMIPQLDRVKEIIDALKIPIYISPKYEADDIIGTAVCKAEDNGLESFIITPDKDLNQLVNENVKVIRPGGKTGEEIVIYDVNKIKEEFGFNPKQMVDYLALIGDSSDNIPGVAGIGPKSAIPLIQKYGSVEGIYEHIEEIEKPSLKNKLIEGKDKALLSKILATIHCEVPIELDFEKIKFKQPDFDKLRELFVELEFKTLYNRLLTVYWNGKKSPLSGEAEEDIPASGKELSGYDPTKVKYVLIKDLKAAQELAQNLSKASLFSFDTETNALNYNISKLAGVSFCARPNEGYYVALNPFMDGDLFTPENLNDRLPVKEFVKIFKPVFENKKIKKVCQNGKFDIASLRSIGIELENFYFDTMLASYVLDPDQKHGMNELSEKYLKYKPIPLSDLLGPKKDSSKIFDVDLNSISCYSCEDADITYKLYEKLSKEIEKEGLTELAYKVEFPLVPVLEDMERTGVKIDLEALNILSSDLQVMMNDYTKKIYDCCGEEFNINSPKQLQEILFTKLGLRKGKKTKTGFSTDAQALEYLRNEHEIVAHILDFRQVSKLKSTYTDALPNLIEPGTGRIHTTFNQAVASTGRLASYDPNLQNIPIRSDLGKEIRKAFIPRDKDHVILSADYSQIDLRIMAGISGDEGLGKAFKNKEDIHKSTAALVFMVDPKDVTPDMRRKAKEVNFGILYGIGPFGLKTRLGVSQTHAKEIIDTYFSTFKRVKNFMDESILMAKQKGYAETLLKRRRFLRNINSSNHVVRQFEERVAINMRVQGTAADMIKLAMINIYNELKKRKAKTKMVLQVHDELVFDAHKNEIDELRPLIKELMENALPLNVPVVADTGIGDNWLDAH
ncbi:MAG: DNA polymerase I [Ignavibacteria bacterium]